MSHTVGQGLTRHRLPGDTRGEEEEEEEAGSGNDARESSERYFSARWMLERERAREESDDCSQAFAIIPVGKFVGGLPSISALSPAAAESGQSYCLLAWVGRSSITFFCVDWRVCVTSRLDDDTSYFYPRSR